MAMIELSMRPDLDYDVEADEVPESAPAAAIEHTYFVVPVRLTVDGQALLAYRGVYADWRPLPVLGFAIQMRGIVTGLKDGQSGTVTLEDGGFLSITRHGDNLVFATSLESITVTALRDDLVIAAERLAQQACEYVRS
ncbi:hypothetical protein [Nocardioides sp. InS609-2]|uniref:hypothetical protein n=1 Tax=Nocardioides sp. InS609-2 TaxID=2760705 RepID=UPI0020BEC6A1|nr:hypothetical protein [Nocardioides sp. InS609-2]